jgi:ribosomal protein L40E
MCLGFCSKCGKELPESAHFCPNCGARTRIGVEAGVSAPSDELRDTFARMGLEMEKAFSTAAKEIQRAFRTARENVQQSINKRAVVCSQCGEKNPSGADFCGKCGKKFD